MKYAINIENLMNVIFGWWKCQDGENFIFYDKIVK